MNNMNLLKDEAAFQKLFQLFRKKYESLGHIGGTVKLKEFSHEELTVISGLTGISVDEMLSRRSLSLKKFELGLEQTVFQAYSLAELLESFFGEPLVSTKRMKEQEEERRQAFLLRVLEEAPAITWYIEWLEQRSAESRWIWGLYSLSEKELFAQLLTLEKAFIALQGVRTYKRVPLFAQEITGNPHALDRNEPLGKLLLHLLTVHQIQQGVDLSFLRSTTDENDLLGQYGLLRDDLWSFVTSQNVLAKTESGVHPVWQAALETQTVLNSPLKELMKIKRMYPASGRNVWIVENSSIASTLMDANPTAPIICTHGQLRLAGWRMIEQLVEAGSKIRYSGDLDPEGIQIADRIKGRFGEAVQFWRMDENVYELYRSNEPIADERLKKLDRVASVEFAGIVENMRLEKKPMYQEAIMELLVEDVRKEQV